MKPEVMKLVLIGALFVSFLSFEIEIKIGPQDEPEETYIEQTTN